MFFRTSRPPIATGSRPGIRCAPVIPLRCHDYAKRRSQRTAWLVTFLTLEALSGLSAFDPSPCLAETKIIPSVIASERYDSNVWFGPPEFVPSGAQQQDFVFAVSPQVHVLAKNRQMDTDLNAGVSGNVYALNPVLDYVSFNAAFSSKLDGWINQFIEGARLSVANSFVYTPQPPTFLTGGQPAQTADVLLRGIQGLRANTFMNNGSVSGSYDLARGFGLQARYNAGIVKFGQILANPPQSTAIPVAYFNTTYHNIGGGPTYTLTPEDTVALNYETLLFNVSGGTTDQSFSTQSLLARYSKATPYWSATISGGATRLNDADDMFFSGNLSLTGHYKQTTRLTATLSRAVAPSFFASGGAQITNTAGLYVEHKLSRLLTLTVGANYALNNTEPTSSFTFKTFQGSALLKYQVTRLISTSLSYEYYNYVYQADNPTGGPASQFAFNRNVVTFMIDATWK